ncbi:retrotransposable element Tf2 [Tanacetum coccineum]
MTPATRNIASTSNNEDGGVNERLRSVKESLAQVTRALQEMVTMSQGINEDDVKGWIFRYEQFFSIDEIPENQKVKLISVHLFDTALLWHRQFIRLNGENVSWNVYKSGILQRFGTVYDDPISEIRNVKYQTNAKDYQDTFDTLSSRVNISEEHAVSFYLGGLPAEIEMGVRMFRPKTLADAYSLTNFQEATLEAVRKKGKSVMTSSRGRFGIGMGQGTHEDEEYYEVEEGGEIMPVQEELPQISLNALNGSNTFQTMRVAGKVAKHKLHILVDCGSTYNFLDDNVAKRIGYPLKDTCPLAVTVGGGKELINTKACKDFVWQLQGETFKADMMILPLGGCEMVLGIQWLAILGDIKCDSSQLKMEFVYNRRRMVLRGAPKATLQWMEGKHQEREVGGVPHDELLMLSVFPNTGIQLMNLSTKSQTVPKELQKVVDQYDDVFALPKELPPQRSYDNRIPLLEGTQPVNIRPYRHPPTHTERCH